MNKILKSKSMIFALICITVAVIMSLYSQHSEFEDKNFQQKWAAFLFALNIALIGIAIFTLKKFKVLGDLLDSLEWIFFILIPIVALMPLLSEPKINLALFFPIYFGASMGWFLVSKHYLVNPMVDGKEKKIHRLSN